MSNRELRTLIYLFVIGTVLLWLALMLTACTDAVVTPPKQSPSVVQLVHTDGRYCSAFAINTATGVRLLTADHCILGDERYFQNGISRSVSIESRNKREDRAMLIPSTEIKPMITGQIPETKSKIYTLAPGISLTGKLLGRGGRYYQTDLDVWPGWSGSPVLNDSDQVIGVIVSCADASTYRNKACVPYTGIFVGLP